MMVEVFKTNVEKEKDTNFIIAIIKRQFPMYKINFDLEDCDKILRVEASDLEPASIIEYLNHLGYSCAVLD
ncbi:hypothetical protein LNP22_08930 [Flavobacterium flavipigmentatum]|nr:hypothetical protein [Flavobacterium sp. F-70]UFH40554.1 hypothetical protein LNP22_08930 [Flavobacterium sp. F-70]